MHRKSDYHYDLPPEQIAQHPAQRRDGARLLVVGDASLADRMFVDLPDLLPEDAVVVVNDTKVVPARVKTKKVTTGGAVELLFVEPAADGGWECLARPLKSLRDGMELVTERGGRTLTVRGVVDDRVIVRVEGDVHAFLDEVGELPLPPYIERDGGLEVADAERYQTVFAREAGAVAAPTAGLHFTPAVLDALRARGATIATVTLHVGLGTFAPVREDDLARHVMHRERFHVPDETAALVASGRPVVAVGTTVVRTLESAAIAEKQVRAGAGDTNLFIRPDTGFRFRAVDHLVTNFHLPESTLLMLVSAFAGVDRIRSAYAHAVAAGYRFFSYGDAMLLSSSSRRS
ncbi:MAG TPA: tRNA preQ1(34) S-adenosylmethionine ribosyltransferase-isomerase QueA [Kofleriaceae bacterium]|nr:tRNA preQ1(34) S-adenosylmethionine ribosyltransferase-isomerase QueA [Kofleriaceae bacterium]